jgi:hypothetical protein
MRTVETPFDPDPAKWTGELTVTPFAGAENCTDWAVAIPVSATKLHQKAPKKPRRSFNLHS